MNSRGLRNLLKRKSYLYIVKRKVQIFTLCMKHIQVMKMKSFGEVNGEMISGLPMAVIEQQGSQYSRGHLRAMFLAMRQIIWKIGNTGSKR